MKKTDKRFSAFYSPIFLIFGSLCIYLIIWFLAAIGTPVCQCWPLKIWATSLGVAGYYLFAFSLLLSTRWKKLENWFGGLDQIYHLHRKLGTWGFCLILLHPWVEALKWLPNRIDKFIFFILPIHGRLSVNLGSYAFWLMLLILGVTFLKLLPYDKWKILHKFMSLVFLLASLHIILSDKRVGSEFAQSLLYIPMGIGFLAIFYKQIYTPFLAKHASFAVTDAKYINDNIVEVILSPKEAFSNFIPGQYGFFTFYGPSLTTESHPFTIIQSVEGATISLLVKARGDYSINLYHHIKKGVSGIFEGPYGRLDYTQAGTSQIWIAGGIGVVPFLAWIRALKKTLPQGMKIDFYYCIHRKADAVFYKEFVELSKTYPDFRVFLCCSEDGSRLDIHKIIESSDNISSKQVFMCGPLKLTSYFKRQFQALGISNDNIFMEDFEFF
jgi:predicted ferric reductase